jgi:leader peptidase (prepilin peptidase)/N-methyltransferase
MVPLSTSAMGSIAASAMLAPLAASGGLWVARATDPALARISAALRPSSVALAAGLAIGIALAASPATAPGFLVCACLAGSAAADRDQFVLPDILTLAAVTLGLVFRPFAPSSSRLELLAVGVGLYVVGTAFAAGMRAWRGRAAFGQGDVKLIAGLGVLLSPTLIAPAILAGATSVIGASLALAAAAAFPSLFGR